MRRLPLAAVIAALLCVLSMVLAPSAGAAPSQTGLDHRNVPVCDRAPDGTAYCHAIRNDKVDSHGNVTPNATPRGYGSADIRSAYNLPGPALNQDGITLATPTGPLVAIVDAYNDPYAEQDLGVYRKQMGLAPCTTANGCFKKVNQNGGSSMPASSGGWAQEISLDLDMVSSACPNCRILLVEASSASFANLGIAVNTAVRLGAVAVSNSYGGSDLSSSSVSGYEQSGVAITASTGDNGYGVEAPASFPHVVAVGGTSLTKTASNARGWTETAWSGAGSGCSTRNSNPGWQSTACGGQKGNADVSAVADPNTGVAVYDSYRYQGVSGWLVFGGTSAASPIIASVYALGTNHGFSYPGQYTWQNAAGNLNDVSSGTNGSCGTSVCDASLSLSNGWDGPTGLGTPWGTGAF